MFTRNKLMHKPNILQNTSTQSAYILYALSIFIHTLCSISKSMALHEAQGLSLNLYHVYTKQHILMNTSHIPTCSLTKYYHVTLTKVHTDRLSKLNMQQRNNTTPLTSYNIPLKWMHVRQP